MKRWLIAGALAFAAAGQALAADLPPPLPPPAPAAFVPAIIPVYNWGGMYFGVNAGWGFGQSDWGGSLVGANTGNFDVSGGLFGGTFGANVQYEAFVFGVEGDFDASYIKGTTNVCVPVACETHNDWLATLRARAGYAANRVLFYGTAGGAFGDIRANVDPTWTHQNRAGWTAGAGVEAAFAPNCAGRISLCRPAERHIQLIGRAGNGQIRRQYRPRRRDV